MTAQQRLLSFLRVHRHVRLHLCLHIRSGLTAATLSAAYVQAKRLRPVTYRARTPSTVCTMRIALSSTSGRMVAKCRLRTVAFGRPTSARVATAWRFSDDRDTWTAMWIDGVIKGGLGSGVEFCGHQHAIWGCARMATCAKLPWRCM